ncbi:MAG TPA: hypothetical protein VKX25_01730 [Bryobacteraceae bacterium]|jgi:hypothetical protein|nr:hypothetical protein [Bryobacteraceae bacterium]
MKRFVVIACLAALVSCGLPSSVRKQIAAEHRHLEDVRQSVSAEQSELGKQLAGNSDLFANRPEPAKWNSEIGEAQQELAQAAQLDRELDQIARADRRNERNRAIGLIGRANQLEEQARTEAQNAETAAGKWIAFKNDPRSHEAELKTAYNQLHGSDADALSKRIEQAEHDWPAKKQALETRYNGVLNLAKDANGIWQRTAEARSDLESGKLTGAETATLIEADDSLAADAAAFHSQENELSALYDQLYTSWDKILVDLDDRDDDYRERIRTVRTHITDLAAHQSETSSSEAWTSVSKPQFESVKNDLGMAIAHKDAGLFDSEANTTPEPAGFAYIAPESVGSNQYGYWTHDHGESVWNWLPQYLILRELLWNHAYRPVVLDEYRGYRVAESAGKTYYGTNATTAAPKYGTHGSFTQRSYASSRYVQSGGFGSSAYASHRFNSSSSQSPRATSFYSEREAGKRFGGNAGRSFGRGAGKSFGRGFGRRR